MMPADIIHPAWPKANIDGEDEWPPVRQSHPIDCHREFIWPHKSKLSMAWELTGWAVAWFLIWIWIWTIIFGIF